MSNKSCPISLVSVDANIARINAFYVGTFFILYLFTMSESIVYFLIIDFMIRLFANKEYSPMFILSRTSKELLGLKNERVDGAPKRLASFFGLAFLLTIALLSILDMTLLFYIFSTILLICISLEVVFSYCLGCEIYHIYKKVFI